MYPLSLQGPQLKLEVEKSDKRAPVYTKNWQILENARSKMARDRNEKMIETRGAR